MLIEIFCKYVLVLSIICNNQSFCKELATYVKEYIPFPERIKELELVPYQFNWSMQNEFIFIDNFRDEVFLLKNNGEINLPSGAKWGNEINSEIIWAGTTHQGIKIVDRLKNNITYMDFRLNTIKTISLNLKLYPDLVAEDPWGLLYIYSQTFGAIFLLDNLSLNIIPFVDLNKERFLSNCISDMETDNDGNLAILGCDGSFNKFSKNGLKTLSYDSILEKSKFLVSIDDDWLIINNNGIGKTIQSKSQITIPNSSLPIVDIQSIGSSIAILTIDHILILNVK